MCTRFNKRHYEAIATVMQTLHPGTDTDCLDYEARLEMWNDMRGELCHAFTADNGSFKRDRFERACQPGANVRARTR